MVSTLVVFPKTKLDCLKALEFFFIKYVFPKEFTIFCIASLVPTKLEEKIGS